MHWLDWVVITVYLAGITAIGLWSARLVKSPDDFFMGGRRFKKTFMLFFAFGAGTHTDQAVSVASKTYTSGLSGIRPHITPDLCDTSSADQPHRSAHIERSEPLNIARRRRSIMPVMGGG